jgi:hypothetical protein
MHAQMKLLAVGIEVMKVQRSNAAIVAAECAAPTRLGYEDPLYLSPSPTHTLQTTALTTVVTTTLEPKLGHAVLSAFSHDRRLPGLPHRTRRFLSDPSLRLGLQSVLSQPVPHSPLAAPKGLCDLRDRHTLVYQCLKLIPCNASPRGMLLSLRRL